MEDVENSNKYYWYNAAYGDGKNCEELVQRIDVELKVRWVNDYHHSKLIL